LNFFLKKICIEICIKKDVDGFVFDRFAGFGFGGSSSFGRKLFFLCEKVTTV
jgi:hypothetical protein